MSHTYFVTNFAYRTYESIVDPANPDHPVCAGFFNSRDDACRAAAALVLETNLDHGVVSVPLNVADNLPQVLLAVIEPTSPPVAEAERYAWERGLDVYLSPSTPHPGVYMRDGHYYAGTVEMQGSTHFAQDVRA